MATVSTGFTTIKDHAFGSADNVAAGAAGTTTGSGPLGWVDTHGGVASVAGGLLTISADGTDGESFYRDFVYEASPTATGQRIDILIPPGGLMNGSTNPLTAVDLMLRRQTGGAYYLGSWSVEDQTATVPHLQFYAVNPASGGSVVPLGTSVACPLYASTHFYRLTGYDAATTAASLTLVLTDHGTTAPPAGPLYNLDGSGTVAAQIATLADSTAGLQSGGSVGLVVHPAGNTVNAAYGVQQVTTSTAVAPATPTPTSSTTTLNPGTISVAAGTPSSSCLTITQGTAPSGGTSPYTVASIARTFDGGATYAPIPSGPWPIYDSEVAPRTTVGYRALLLDSGGQAAYTPTVAATTTAPVGAQTKLLVCGIDSKTNGYLSSPQGGQVVNPTNSGTSTPAWLGMLLGDAWDVENVGIDGQTIPQAMAANREAAYLNAAKYTGGQFYLLFGGCNDLRGGATAAQTYANLKAYAAQLVAAGWRLIVCTNPDNLDPASSYATAGQDAFNAMIRAGWQTDLGAVALCDYASSNLFGLDGTTGRADHANYWATADSPKVEHYNDRGYLELAKFAAGVIAQAAHPATVSVAPTPSGLSPQDEAALAMIPGLVQTVAAIQSQTASPLTANQIGQLAQITTVLNLLNNRPHDALTTADADLVNSRLLARVGPLDALVAEGSGYYQLTPDNLSVRVMNYLKQEAFRFPASGRTSVDFSFAGTT